MKLSKMAEAGLEFALKEIELCKDRRGNIETDSFSVEFFLDLDEGNGCPVAITLNATINVHG